MPEISSIRPGSNCLYQGEGGCIRFGSDSRPTKNPADTLSRSAADLACAFQCRGGGPSCGPGSCYAGDRANPLDEFRSVNVGGTEALASLAAKQGVRRFIYMSSIGVNGEATNGNPFPPMIRLVIRPLRAVEVGGRRAAAADCSRNQHAMGHRPTAPGVRSLRTGKLPCPTAISVSRYTVAPRKPS